MARHGLGFFLVQLQGEYPLRGQGRDIGIRTENRDQGFQDIGYSAHGMALRM